MDNLSTEVGHKMRSAVKAKLIELGTGGSTGYIDDELPDYVMIMVANKRSKQQMTEDLNLFLNENTGEFVNWLHQVLQKLQEVAIPATAVVAKMKTKKPSESTDKKDKKDKKKKLKRSHKSKSEATGGSPQEQAPVNSQSTHASITDVFADHLIQKARSTISLEQSLTVKGKKEQSDLAAVSEAAALPNKSVDDFDIPTITEIAESAAVKVNRRKDISALADLQRKINQAKRQLKAMNSEESEDEDFINIKDDGEEEELADADGCNEDEKADSTMENVNETQSDNENPARDRSHRVPITFRHDERRTSESFSAKSSTQGTAKKRSIMERLGVRQQSNRNETAKDHSSNPTGNSTIVSLSAHRRSEQEIYVPTFRRKDDDRKSERERESRNQNRITKTTTRDAPAIRDLRDRVKGGDRNDRKPTLSHPSKTLRSLHRSEFDSAAAKKRLVESRVFVAPPKPEYVEDAIEVPVNSIVKIQPRPLVPTNQQASKNLLMRAVAEAQRSTALIRPVQHKTSREKSPTLALGSSDRNQKLYTKSYRDRNSGLGKGKTNIVIEVASDITQQALDEDDEVIEMSDVDEGFAYVPLNISSANSDDDMKSSPYESDSDKKTNTLFVVTLDDADKIAPRLHHRRQHHIRKQPLSIDETIVPITVDVATEGAIVKSEATSSPLTVELTTQKVNRLIIQNDTEDEEELRKEVERSTSVSVKPIPNSSNDSSSQSKRRSQKRRHVSPIKFDIKNEEEPKRPKSGGSPTDDGYSGDYRGSKNGDTDEFRLASTKRTEGSRKYDNIPPLSSAITIADQAASGRSKSSDRCKYYPICGKGDKCEFTHPSGGSASTTCKQFPNCKFGDQCLYFHPRCKFDLTCTRHGCSFSHTSSALTSTAPPLSSHVVPVTNYKSITNTPLPTMCKFYPNCTNGLCTFFHPKPCRFGKNCTNKVECNFYHFDMMVPPTKDKLKWVASSTVY